MRRRRKHQRNAWVLGGSFAVSGLVHLLLANPLMDWVEAYFAAGGGSKPSEVRVVRLSPSAWRASLEAARQVGQKARTEAAASETLPPQPPKPKAPKPKQERLTGQVVEVPPTQDSSPNPDAKYLSKYNAHVDKETVARLEERNPAMKRVSNKLETRRRPSPARGAVLTPGLSVEGTGAAKAKPKKKKAKKKKQRQIPGKSGSRFSLEVPDLKRRDSVQLKLSDLPGLGPSVANRTESQALKGNSNRFRLESGAKDQDDEEGASGGKGGLNGLPTLSALAPALGASASADGSPSRDHVEGLPEGDGTFLNTKEFKYATFFFRVRDSVAGYWEDLAVSEYRRRDPTGNIYGGRDRATLLNIQLTREGRIGRIRVKETSGVRFLDDVAVKAFNLAEPFPNPPAGIADEDGNIRFNFQFVVTMRASSPLQIFK